MNRFKHTQKSIQSESNELISMRSIRHIVANFEKNKCLCYKRKCKNGRKKTATADLNVDEVMNSVENNPAESIPIRAMNLNMNHSAVQRILKRPQYNPYKPKEGQKLSDNCKVKRVRFCDKILSSNINTNKVIFSDEKRFYLNHPQNHENNRFWSRNKPVVKLMN